MNKKTILMGAAAAAVLCALDASAQFNYQNGDMIAAFGSSGSTNDVIVDLGSISQYQQAGGAPITRDLSSVLNSVFGGVSGNMYWAVFGVNDGGGNPSVVQNDPNTVWATLARSNPSSQTHAPFIAPYGSGTFQLTLSQIQSIAGDTSPSAATGGGIQDIGSDIAIVSTAIGQFSPLMTSPYSGNFGNEWPYNVLNNGVSVSDLYQNDSAFAHASYLGDFSLDGNGGLTFNPVPEPSTWAMVGSGMLAFFAIRRRK